jgi:hypothetical protein
MSGCIAEGTKTTEPVYVSVGESDFYFADFDPPGMPSNRRPLAGENGVDRSIVSATAELMNGAAGTISDVSVIASTTAVDEILMETGTAVKFKAEGLQVNPTGGETLVKILATLSDGAIKPLVFRIIVEP